MEYHHINYILVVFSSCLALVSISTGETHLRCIEK
jgi:hypothetical protein